MRQPAQRGGAPADALERVSADLLGLAETVAAELARPASARDAARAEAAAARIESLHARFKRAVCAVEARLGDPPATLPAAERQRLRRLLRDGGFQLGRWKAVLACVREQAAGDRRPLMPPDRPRHDLLEAQLAVSDAASLAMYALVNPNTQAAEAKAHGCHPDIRMKPSHFLEFAHAAYRLVLARRRPGPYRFLDVGCGGGGKVLLAAGFFDEADGLEYDPGYARAARDLVAATASGRCRAIEGDALSFDGYGGYDVVYFFEPMSERAKLRALEERIVGQIRPGTVLIAPYQHFLLRSDKLGCPQVARNVHVAGVAPRDAAAQHAEAERIGATVVRGRAPDARCGFWTPIVAACLANGFDPLR